MILFLYIDPLKQGLKHPWNTLLSLGQKKFLYIDPLKQGLKHKLLKQIDVFTEFLYIDPLKQGLKRNNGYVRHHCNSVFIHRSIKTRIETIQSHNDSFLQSICFYT